MRNSGLALLVLLLFLNACSSEPASRVEYDTPAQVLVAMKNQYAGSWYERMTFVQTTIQYAADGTSDTTTWFEAMELPGKLRIDIGEPTDENTWLFRNDSIYVFTQGILSVFNHVEIFDRFLFISFSLSDIE